ncbi:hypothetical protein GCM10022220_07490 [Actinocatenispora rupis]|uniref:Lipoprotein n=1 Tax=Actinocatenispora rupis TaxID=519421 RepID=A0A8J3NA29_9ACTN|nr:hypothetical protein Aru02nite_25650 [Actinocatenispora rupis]
MLALAAGLLLAGCGHDAAAVTAPAFRVPTPPPMAGATAGTLAQANQFLTSFVHGLDAVRDPKVAVATLRSCGDATCRHLVAVARSMPRTSEGDYGAGWSMEYGDTMMAADPAHPGSWSVAIRPFWRASETPYGGHDGWTTATMIDVRLKLVGKDPMSDFRVWMTPIPASRQAPAAISLDHPRIG